MPSSSKKYRWLILPLETKVRELDGKLLLAATAAERGWAVALGQTESIVVDTAGIQGVVLEKDGYFGNPRIGPFLKAGNRVCALDEEGLVYLNGPDYYRRRLDKSNLRRLELAFVWGENQKHDILEHVHGIGGKLVLSGNPRFDLLRSELRGYYAAEASRLKNQYGPYLLVNTNFADSNHFMGSDWVIGNLRNNRSITSRGQEADERAFMKYQRGILEHFVAMLGEVAASFPRHTIILRPHPSEDHALWRAATWALKNVTVMHEGDVNPWLLAAELSIHNSCMTGIQGFLLDRPTIAFVPERSDRFDYFLPNALSSEARTPAEIVSLIDRFIRSGGSVASSERNAKLATAQRFITGISGPLASDRIMNALERPEIEPGGHAAPALSPNRPATLDTAVRQLWGRSKKILRRSLLGERESQFTTADPKYLAYTRQKYPGMRLEELQSKLRQLQSATGRFGNVEVLPWGRRVFCVVPN